ncbi:sensor histidine kinase [Xylanibacter ruminicola]|jgi:signal transduction histidine kinase|uniref:histidine kinase n=1 Tax=Xylanibacter ruminicola TaxID=839 RepID=A0A1M6X5G3_XYLRU|nr:HAMP domain-containing sensor histidine kinase [Xylanibacter ruminicola]SHL01178.1 Signal transduction histidine kinase [Xylanibacter ruminicola]
MDIWQIIVVFLLLVIVVGFCVLRNYYRLLLRKEVDRARRSEHLKTVFLANVSHALRNPLNNIISKSNDLLTTGVENTKPNQLTDSLAQINKDGNQLMYFISQLLELSNFESGLQTFTLIEVNLAELMASYRREAQRNVAPNVAVYVRSKLSPHCKGTLDTNLMYQLMMHLLQNAIRHTTEGSISIVYEAERDGLQVSIIDTGDGVPQKFHGNISNVLQGDESLNMFNKNSGLGLSICKAIVDGMNGEISLKSEEGKGTTVTVYFPCRLRDKKKGL